MDGGRGSAIPELAGAVRTAADLAARQVAISEVLAIIGDPTSDLATVLKAVLTSAIRLCGAEFGTIYLEDGDVYRIAAAAGTHDIEAIQAHERDHPNRPGRHSITGRVLMTGQPQQIHDVLADPEYDQPIAQRISGFRTLLGVPIVRERRVAGVFDLGRTEVRPFTDDEIALVATFAGQVAVAIEIARLVEEQVTRQTATTEVLRIVGRPDLGLAAVLKAIVESAARLCEAPFGTIYLRDGDVYRAAAGAGLGEETAAYERDHPDRPGRHSVVGRVLLSDDVVQIADVRTDSEYDQPEAQQILSLRTILGVPIRRGDELIGVFNMGKPEVAPFDASEIALVATFAGQVAVAIEIARLIEQQIARQSATTEALRIVGRSDLGLDAVLKAIIESATHLCHADFGVIYLRDGEAYRASAGAGAGGETLAGLERDHPDHAGRHSVVGRVILSRGVIQIDDILADPEYDQPIARDALGLRTILGVPIIADGELIGVCNMGKPEVAPFTESEIALVATFAEGIAIAIENTRLLETIDRQRGELARYISGPVAELITSPEGERLLEGHRRRITAVFCDLRGFTTFSESVEPEEVLGVLRDYHAVLGRLVVEHGGTLEHFAGDGVMVFFNDPIPQDDHEFRAVEMAVAMRDQVADLAAGWHRRGYDLDFGVGVVAGYATLGRIGFEGRYDYGAIGNAVILASRLSSEAAAGQILLDQRTYAAVEDRIEAEAIGDLQLKGVSRPVGAYNVRSIRPSA